MKRKYVCWIGIVVTIIVCIVVATVLIVLLNKEKTVPPEVRVSEGVLEGQWVFDATIEKEYASFRGIPYAQTPDGPLRFKAPRPPLQYEGGKREATQESADCWQQSSVSSEAVGSEDCLYLNVYTPSLPDKAQKLRPVYFFIHGGTFLFGSANQSIFGPEFLMLQDIVVVTIKYRLNVFGFLNLNNEIVPGNAGIKDQIAALKWVHQNIENFGGDPKQITVGGQSAGAVSAHWLTLLPESQGLIQSVILESGSALHSWGYNEDNIEIAQDLSRYVANNTMNLDDFSRIMMNLPAKTIMDASIPMVNLRINTLNTQIPYAPSPERRPLVNGGEKPLIIQSPERYILDADFVPKPMFVGMNSREWLASFYSYGYENFTLVEYRIETLINLLPKNIIPYRDTIEYLNLTDVSSKFNWSDVVDKVREHYFSPFDRNCDVICIFKKYLDDIVIGVDIDRLVDLRSSNRLSTTYVYRFSIRDEYSISPFLDPGQSPGGAVHSDELGYIWKIGGLTQTSQGDTTASRTLLRMTNMWGSFIRNGTPSPDGHLTWRPTEKRNSSIIFLEIKDEVEEKEEDIAGSYMPFWFDLYRQYRQQ